MKCSGSRASFSRGSARSLPSIEPSEAFGIASAEAMSCGKPTVVCELNNGVNHLNQAGRTSLAVAPRDVPALADALDTLAADDARRRQQTVKPFIEVCAVTGVSWLSGIVGAAALNIVLWHEELGSDFLVVAGWSTPLFVVSIVAVDVPALYALSRIRRPVSPVLAALVGASLGVVPLGLLHWLWEGHLAVVLTGVAARLFLPIFAVGGATFGAGSVARE